MNEYVKVHKIEKYINRKLPELTIEGMKLARKRKSAGGKPKGKGGWGDRKSGGWRGDHKPGKEGFGGKTRGEGFKKEGFKKDSFKKTGEGFKGKRKAGDSFAGKSERRYKDR